MTGRLFVIIALIIVGFIGFGIINSDDSQNGNSSDVQSNNFFGKADASVELIEAGDFECPACFSFYPIVSQIKEEYADRIKFSYKHFPLTAIHPNAQAAHRAAEAAARQGKFWEMHDLLFEQRNLWIASATDNPVPQFEAFAEQLELDIDKFRTDFVDPETNSIINNDIKAMKDLGAEATPTFFVNGQLVENSQLGGLEQMRAVLDEALAENSENNDSN